MVSISGSSANDSFTTTGENDAFWGGAGGFDTLTLSGALTDYAITDNGDGSYQITDLRENAPDGSDKIRDIDQLAFTDGVYSLADAYAIRGRLHFGATGDDALSGGAGDDKFYASGGVDSVYGGSAGADALYLSGSLYDYAIIDNQDGSYWVKDLRDGQPDGEIKLRNVETLVFSDGEHAVDNVARIAGRAFEGTVGDDSFSGGYGDDVFYASGGVDTFWGGMDGDDSLILTGDLSAYDLLVNSNGAVVLTDMRDGSPDGVITVRDVDFFSFADLSLNFEELIASKVFNLDGGAGDDKMNGSAGDDVFYITAGNDRAWGGVGGEDMIVFNGDFDDYKLWDRGDGSYLLRDLRQGAPDGQNVFRDIEVIRFADRTVSLEQLVELHQAAAPLSVTGTAGDDNIHGTAGDDVFQAHGGNDRIWGGQGGVDILALSGRLGDYILTDNGSNGAYTFYDTRAGGGDGVKVVRDMDFIRFSDGDVAWGDLSVAATFTHTAEHYRGTAAGDFLTGANTRGVFDAHSNDRLEGFAGDDWIFGGHGDDVIWGDVSSETLLSGSAPVYTSHPETELTRFTFDDGLYQTMNGKLFKLDASSGAYEPIGAKHPGYNAVGLNEADGYAYGVGTRGHLKGHLIRIGAEGGVEKLGSGFPSVAAGGFADDGLLYLRAGRTTLMAINVETQERQALQFDGQGSNSIYDIVHIAESGGAGAFYGLDKYGKLYIYDLDTKSVTSKYVDGITEIGAFGAGWVDATGGLYFSHNATGKIFGISGLNSERPSAGLLATVGKSSINDGFSFSSAPLPEELLGDGADILMGGGGDDEIHGGGGDDMLDGGVGADRLDGGEGYDTAGYTRAAARVVVDLISGGSEGEAKGDSYSGVERVAGSDFADVIKGDNDDNALSGRGGDDQLFGRGGDDTLRGGAGADFMDGGDGVDTVSYFEATTGVTIDAGARQGARGDAEGDWYQNIERFQGSNVGFDVMSGSSGRDQFFAFGGDDQLFGYAGNDHLDGGAGDDHIQGGAGDDRLLGQDGADALYGEAGVDHLAGGAGDDALFGGDGVDHLSGGDGADRLSGGAGMDYMRGGAGADQFIFALEGDRDRIRDFELNQDEVHFEFAGEVGDLVFTRTSNVGVDIAHASAPSDIILHIENISILDVDQIVFVFDV